MWQHVLYVHVSAWFYIIYLKYTIFFLKYAIDFMIFCDKRIVCYLEIAAALIISYLLCVFSEFLYVEEDTT